MPDPESGLFGDPALHQRMRIDIEGLTKAERKDLVKASLVFPCVAAGIAARTRPQALPRAFKGGQGEGGDGRGRAPPGVGEEGLWRGNTKVLTDSKKACGTSDVTVDFGGPGGAGANVELEFPEPITRKKAYKRLKRVYGGKVLSTLVGVKPEEAAAVQPGVGAGVY